MMAKFDEEKFRSSAKVAGYSDAEIDAELKSIPAPAGAAVPNMVPIADGRETTAAFEKEAQAKGEQLIKEANQEAKATLEAPPFDFMKAINSPVGYVTGAATLAALSAGAYVGAKKLGLFDRKINKPEVDRTIDIPMDTVQKRNVSPFAQQFEATYGVPLSTAEQLTGGPITNPKDAAIIGGVLKNQGGLAPNTPYQTTSYTQAPAPVAPTVPTAPTAPQANAPVAPTDPFAPRPNPYITPSVQEGVATGNTAQAVQTVVAQELDKATGVAPTQPVTPKAPKKQPAVLTFKSEKDIPEGYIFRKDVGNLDRSLGNILGLEHRANAREMFTGGKPFGQFTGSGPTAFNDEISRLTTNYFQNLQSQIPETILSRDARKAQGIPSDFGTYATKTNFGKAAKVAGVAGTLIAATDIANAAQQGKYGQAAVQSVDLATDYIPMVAQLKQGLAPTEAGAPGVSKQRIESAALLGSPFAQTEWAKSQRQKEKAGAGRGIAPPSAYMR
jgi:hypothetical protein